VTNTGLTLVDGNLGVWPGTAITGFNGFGAGGPGILTGGAFYVGPGPGVAETAQGDLTTAYNTAAAEACGTTGLSDQVLGQTMGTAGSPLSPGVYCASSSAQLTGTLYLDAGGDPNAVFVFQVDSALTTASNSAVDFVNGDTGANVFWQIGSSATLGTGTAFAGNILALQSITLNTGASIDCGSALASTGAVTLDSNNVIGCASAGTPEPGTVPLLGIGLFALTLYGWQSRKRAA
jgi:type VI secretion system secreted protein VgrG